MNYKIAIIGAGANGLYLAKNLSEKGHKAVVFERKQEIGKKACSGLFSERILDFVPESENIIKNRISRAVIHFPRKSVEIVFSKDFFVMSHYELDIMLAGLAGKAGAEIFLGSAVNSIPEGFDRVIGCDGPNSFIRKFLKLPDPFFRLGILGFLEKKDNSDFVEAWPVERGFIWKIPRGENVEYGIVAKKEEAKPLLDDFLRRKGIKLEGVESALVPQGLVLPRNKNITLCGDAAGLTKPWSGGGVVWGMSLADVLLKNFPNFLKYQKEAKKKFQARICFSKVFTKAVYSLGHRASWALPKRAKIESDFLF